MGNLLGMNDEGDVSAGLRGKAAELRSEMKERESQLNNTATDLANVELKLEEKALLFKNCPKTFSPFVIYLVLNVKCQGNSCYIRT